MNHAILSNSISSEDPLEFRLSHAGEPYIRYSREHGLYIFEIAVCVNFPLRFLHCGSLVGQLKIL